VLSGGTRARVRLLRARWLENDPESFDKEYVRRWLAAQGFTGPGPVPPIPDDVRVEATRRYIHAVETLTGEPFRPDLEPPGPRIARNLGLS
jgi:phosphoribosylaminoimidazole-succinocarboxamide synthase